MDVMLECLFLRGFVQVRTEKAVKRLLQNVRMVESQFNSKLPRSQNDGDSEML